MSQETPKLQDGGFELLLAWLDPNRERGAMEHVHMHSILTRHFAAKSCNTPEDLADATLDRVGSILLTGKDLSAYNREAYLKRVAYYVQHEYWRARKPMDQLPDGRSGFPDDRSRSSIEFDVDSNKERRHLCLDQCLNELLPEERLFLLEYYSEDKTAKLDTRDRMAKGLGISSGALRQRTSKLRARVRTCVSNCAER